MNNGMFILNGFVKESNLRIQKRPLNFEDQIHFLARQLSASVYVNKKKKEKAEIAFYNLCILYSLLTLAVFLFLCWY